MWAAASRDTPGASSILLVPGVPWTNLEGPHGAVAKHIYSSAIIGAPETYYVYTPPDYDHKRKAPYPVLVTLHGLGDSAQDWLVQGGANLTLDSLIAAGKAKSMILVSPSGYGTTQGTRGAAAGFPNFTRALLEEILPLVEKQYNASTKPSERAITGLSMGAAQSLLLLNHLDQFQWIGSFSPGFDMYSSQWGSGARNGAPKGGRGPQSVPGGGRGPATRQRPPLAEGVLESAFPHLDGRANKQIKLLYITCGAADDHLELTRQFKAFLDARKIESNYSEPENAAHVWAFWRRQFAIFASQLFQ